MSILITGGTGFIGRFTARRLIDSGRRVVLVGSPGSQALHMSILPAVNYPTGIHNVEQMRSVFRVHSVDTVIHLAGSSRVPESVLNPASCFTTNVSGSLALLEAMAAEKVKRIIFASSGAVYGNACSTRIAESCDTIPVSPYADSKLMVERALKWYEGAYGITSVCFRYFNVAGASVLDQLGEDPNESVRIIPMLFRAARTTSPFTIFGREYPTPDGTAIRDYVHVGDVATANVRAVDYLSSGKPSTVINIGSGTGSSVLQVIKAVSTALGCTIPTKLGVPHPELPACAIADVSHAHEVLGWTPRRSSLEHIVSSAICYYREYRHPC
jgi:UDP-glucose 4-epimerase